MSEIRPVCWPMPDKVCAEGGCIYCVDSKTFKTANQIARAAKVDRWAVDMDKYRDLKPVRRTKKSEH
jgi:hypothetical protein